KLSMPRETLERALKKSAAKDTANLELLTYEGFAPHRVAVIFECLTDNVNRTGPEIRVLFRKGQLGTSVSWDFDHLGMIEAVPTRSDADAELAAIEAGAQELEPAEDSAWLFLTSPTDLDLVCKALPAQGFQVQSARLGYKAKNPVTLGDAERQEVEAFLAALDNHDDVQSIYAAL
ncbi:MAG: YebC/PmpR family DNA-binding transcriptional regulator, partial [Candidatus Xenobia bacterium]